MKKAFTLIELIFTIVIMAGVFAVIPKILNMTNKSDSIALKQDALLQAVSLTNIASFLAWDEQNTQNIDILQTTTDNNHCDSAGTHMRSGSYKSQNGRVCEQTLNASTIGSDGESSYMEYDDIDDFNGSDIDVNTSTNKAKYKIYTSVDYLLDDATIFVENGNKLTIDLNKTTKSTNYTNIKKFKAKVGYVGRGIDHNITSFRYFSANLGTFTLNSRAW
jgi:prepilin-type N-terminal cleavage/methylation domain-containing protein